MTWLAAFGGRFARPAAAPARRRVSRYRLDQAADPNAAEDIKKKLPSMYHQFKELADVDITTEPMEVGPTCHYMMGGVRVDAETQESTVPGLFAAGESAAGMHGANRLGGNSLSDCWCLASAPANTRPGMRTRAGRRYSDCDEVEARRHEALEPFEGGQGEESISDSGRVAGDDAGSGRHCEKRSGDARSARRARDNCASGRRASASAAISNTIPGGTWRWI